MEPDTYKLRDYGEPNPAFPDGVNCPKCGGLNRPWSERCCHCGVHFSPEAAMVQFTGAETVDPPPPPKWLQVVSVLLLSVIGLAILAALIVVLAVFIL
ncbi:MAG: hypothetical protein WD768_07945 [Phycisphaeraceae bacterium]